MKSNKKFGYIVFIVFIFFSIFLNGCDLKIKPNISNTIDMTPRLIELSGTSSATNVVETVKGAIVGIRSSLNGGYAVGSGVAIKEGGYILTNQHVISGSKGITVYFADNTATTASLIWQDSSIDLAVIKSNIDMPYLSVETESLAVGEDVLAIGTPLSLAFQHTVTKGIISALNRTIEIDNDNGTVSYMQNLIQHDASINPGNSGGPLINMSGKVIGINTLKASGAEGIGFAIPIIAGRVVVDRLFENVGYTAPYMGVFGVSSAYARAKEISIDGDGLYIMGIDEKGISKLKGIMVGDIIYKIDDYKINDFMDLRRFLYSKNTGDEITVYLYRFGTEMQIKMII
ncbi:MAG: trypsin-like peptidase domain-containing protein [Clostridia bacterium]|nr:trypsin-like peptidase domain-containing protein [Clostridia bacterium]